MIRYFCEYYTMRGMNVVTTFEDLSNDAEAVAFFLAAHPGRVVNVYYREMRTKYMHSEHATARFAVSIMVLERNFR